MAVSTALTVATEAAVLASGTSVDPAAAVPDNCHTMLILNTSGVNTILVGHAVAPAPLAAASSINLPPNASVTLAIGKQSVRAGPASGGDAANPGLVYDSVGGAATARITYVNGFDA